MTNRILLISLVLAGACGSPDTAFDDECGPNGECAPGFECRAVDRRCVRATPQPTPDAAVPAPDAPAETLGCAAPAHGPTLHSSDIATDEVWSADGSPHIVTGQVRLLGAATLSVEPCAEVRMAKGVTIVSGFNGASKVRAVGTEMRPITIRQNVAGERFGAIEAHHPGSAELAYVTIEGGGAAPFRRGASVVGWGDGARPVKPVLLLDHVSVVESAGMGVLLERFGTFAPGSRALSVTGSGVELGGEGEAVRLDTAAAGDLPAGSYAGNGLDAVTLFGGIVDMPLSLHAAGVPYRVENATSLLVRDGGLLELGPGVEIQLAETSGIDVRGGQLVARGTAEAPVRIIPRGALPWLQLGVTAPGKLSLTHTILEHGGGDKFTFNAALVARGDGTLPLDPVLHVDHVTVRNAGGIGVLVERFAAFDAESTDLTITGSAFQAARVALPAVSTLPTGAYAGNAIDAIVIDASQTVVDSDTFRDRGVPYVSTSTIGVKPPAGDRMARLVIEPGVTLKFPRGQGMVIGAGSSSSAAWPGELVAVGTPEKPIVFSSAEPVPAAGDWMGIYFQGYRPTGNRIAQARVEYAGASCLCSLSSCVDREESGVMFSHYPLSEKPISATVFAHIDGNGIFNSFRTDDAEALDMTADNQFEDVGGCAQTMIMTASGTCSRECL